MSDDDGAPLSESELWGMLEDATGIERAAIMHELGARLFARGEFEQSVVLAESAAEVAATSGDDSLRARSLYGQAAGLRRLGRHEDTVRTALEAADILRTASDQTDIAECHATAASAMVDMGQDLSSLDQWESAARLYLSEDEPAEAGRMLLFRGEALGRLGRPEDALAEYDQARDLFRKGHQASAVPWADDRAATALADLGKIDEAIDRLESALHVRQAQRDPQLSGYAHFRLGWALRLSLRLDEALKQLEIAAQIFDELEDLDGRARCDLEAANTLATMGDVAQADQLYRRVRAVFDAEGFDEQVLLVDANRAVMLSHLGDAAGSAALNSRILPQALADGYVGLAAEVRPRLARNLLETGHPAQALDVLAAASPGELEHLGSRADGVETKALRAEILLQIDPEAAVALADEAVASIGDDERWADIARLYEVRGRGRLTPRRTRTAERDLAHAVALYLAAGMTDRAREISELILPKAAAKGHRMAELAKALRGQVPDVPGHTIED